MENTIIDFCKTNNIEFISTEIVNDNRKVTFIATECGHERTALWSRLKKLAYVELCLSCYNNGKITYIDLIKVFENNNCKVLTTEEEFKNINTLKDKINYIAQCGHQHLIILNAFKNCEQGKKCTNCTLEDRRQTNINNCENDKMIACKIESEGNQIFKNILKDLFIVERTFEGCIVDIYIKPININEDLWLPVQMKSTARKGSQNRYMFNNSSNDYSNLVLCCMSNEDQRFWIFDNDNHPNVNIGISKINEKSKSKYDKFEVTSNNLVEKFSELYKSQKLISKKEALTPFYDSACKEVKYRLIREEKIDYLNFEYPEIQLQNYDFTINKKKVQEKILTILKKGRGLKASLCKCLGRYDKCPYEKNDNEFYWFHIQDSQQFYIIPQEVLINNGYIKSDKFNGRKEITLFPMCTVEDATKLKYLSAECNNYLFSYDNIKDIDTIKKLFKN